MPNPTVRISHYAHTALKELALKRGESMQEIIDRAIEHYHREQFLEEANASYAALAQDPEAWKAWQDELRSLDGTLLDGLQPE